MASLIAIAMAMTIALPASLIAIISSASPMRTR